MRKPVLSFLLDVCAWPIRVVRARRALAEIAALDDRGLADIGLGRHDLRDMTAYALSEDPTERLATRARERAEAVIAARAARPQGPTPPAARAASISRDEIAA